jgi:hypothetical protein
MKLKLAPAFVPTKNVENIDLTKFKAAIEAHRGTEFKFQLHLLLTEWKHIHNLSWHAVVSRLGKFKRKGPHKRIILSADATNIFLGSLTLELADLDLMMRIYASATPQQAQFLEAYAKFKIDCFGPKVPDLLQSLMIKNDFYTENKPCEYHVKIMKNVYADYCKIILFKLDKMVEMYKISKFATAVDITSFQVLPHTSVGAISVESCLMHDYLIMKEQMGSHVPMDYVTKFCGQVRKEFCTDIECLRYHLTNADIIFYQGWLNKTRMTITAIIETRTVHRMIFVDTDNTMDWCANRSYNNHDLIILFGNKNSNSEHLSQLNIIVIPSLLKTKDAADVEMVKEALYWNKYLPLDIDVVLIARDEFVCELYVEIQYTRNCHLVYNQSLEFTYVKIWNAEFKRLMQQCQPRTWLGKPSRVANAILSRDERFCCCLDVSGLPCNRPRFSLLVTCQEHA